MDPFIDDTKGGMNQFLSLSLSNTKTSILCETKNAVEPANGRKVSVPIAWITASTVGISTI